MQVSWQGLSQGVASGVIRHGLMLQINEQLVLDFVRDRGWTSRTEIAAGLGLSAATVSRIVRRLAVEDLVREEPGESTGGRPRTAVAFNVRSGCVIGVALGGTKCHGVLADLGGSILAEDLRGSTDDGPPFATLVETIERLDHSRERGGSPLVAVAVGVPAIVDPGTGVAIGGPSVRWNGFPIVAALRKHVDVPFVIDNDVNLAALGHAWRGDARGVADFAVINLGTGIGAAVVADGRLVRGHANSAGEIGFMVLDHDRLRGSRQGDLGAFETQASGPAVADIATRVLQATERSSSLRSLGRRPGSADVFSAAAAGDAIAGDVVTSMVDHVAMAIIALGSVTDPEVVVLDGAVGRALVGVRDTIQELVDRHLATPPRIVVSTLREDATALGAVAAALDLSRSARRSTAPSSSAELVESAGRLEQVRA
jgi:glucokinase